MEIIHWIIQVHDALAALSADIEARRRVLTAAYALVSLEVHSIYSFLLFSQFTYLLVSNSTYMHT